MIAMINNGQFSAVAGADDCDGEMKLLPCI
jgi:hypothetical protein